MSRFDADNSASASAHLWYFGRSAVYTSAAGVSTAVTVIAGAINETVEEREEGRVLVRRRAIQTETASIASHAPGDRVTLDGEEWIWERMDSQSRGLDACTYQRIEPIEKTFVKRK
jgi:hypothetical protein